MIFSDAASFFNLKKLFSKKFFHKIFRYKIFYKGQSTFWKFVPGFIKMYQALGKYMGKIFLKNFLTIFLISKKIFGKFENFLKNDSASEKIINSL